MAKAKELSTLGHDVVSLTVGEPDWPTFAKVSEEGKKAIDENSTKYTPVSGTIELKKALVSDFKKHLGMEYTPNQILVGPGAKFVIFSALQVLCNPGDEVIIHSPYWVSYPTMVELAEGVPHIVTCDEDSHFKLTARRLEQAITSKTKVFLFCSPSNPTGLVYSKQELAEFAEIFRRNPQVFIISDDIYNRLDFSGDVSPHLLHGAPDLKERLICVNGGSKSFSMTGWRIGWAAGPQKIIAAMGDYQSQSTGAPNSISQQAVLRALIDCDDDVKKTVSVLKERKTQCMSWVSEVPGFRAVEPQGAFYLWVNVKPCLGKSFRGEKIESDKVLANILLEKFFVATVPGQEFGNNGYLRLSFATKLELFKKATDRMKQFVKELV